MAKRTSAHLKACNIAASEAHNKRTKKLNYIHENLTCNNESFFYIDHSLRKELSNIKREVKKKTGRKLQKNAVPIKEDVVVIKHDTTIDELKVYCERCREEIGIIPLQIYTHKDEGHKKNKECLNYHAHVIWRVYSEDGRNVSPTPYQCSKMQTIAAECLGMERGIPSNKKHFDALKFKIIQEQNRCEELMKEIEELQTERIEIRSDVLNLRSEADSLRKEIETLQKALETPQKGILGVLKGKLSNFSNSANELLEKLDLGNVRRVQELESKVKSLEEDLEKERGNKNKFISKVIEESDEDLRQMRNKYNQNLQESGDYKYKYEELSRNISDNSNYKAAWNILPDVTNDSENKNLNLSQQQVMDIALFKTIGIEQLPSGEKLSDIGDKGDIEMKWDKNLRSIVIRMTNSMKKHGERVWVDPDFWKDRFKQIKDKLLKPIEQKISKTKKHIKGKNLSV